MRPSSASILRSPDGDNGPLGGGQDAARPDAAPTSDWARGQIGGGGSTPTARVGDSPAGRSEAILPEVPGYRLLRELGAGGFGRVYEAVSDDSVQMRVAIKVLFKGSNDALRRFETEKKVLANLVHPNIARYQASGVLPNGMPWIAMEYIEGMQLDKYCEREQLSTAERLEIFAKICDAVQHAHEYGVWHLDLKPLNILITLDGQPKLLDFGIAKVSRSLDSGEHLSETRSFVTYLYSSPEQLRGEPVSSRSDVYNLGLILYELLTGSRLRNPRLKQAEDLIRSVLDTDPEPPSRRVARRAEIVGGEFDTGMLGTTTAQGGTSRLSRRLRGDLDNIVLMALRREPTKRYASPRALADDLQRHRDGVPVEARRASVGYRFARELQRRRVAIAIAGLALVASAATGLALWAQARATAQGEALAFSEQIVSLQDENLKLLADGYRKYSAGFGWLEMEYSQSSRNPLEVFEAQAGIERAQIEALKPRGGVSRTVAREHLKTLLRLAATCKHGREYEKGLKAVGEAREILALAAQASPDAMEDRELDVRVLEVEADLHMSVGVDDKARPLHERAYAIRLAIADETRRAPDALYNLNKTRQRVLEHMMAAREFEQALALADTLVTERAALLEVERADEKRAPRYERDLMLAHHWRAKARVRSGKVEEAAPDAARALEVAQARFDRSNKQKEPQLDLALALECSAQVAAMQARFADAVAHLERATEHAEQAIALSGLNAGAVMLGFEVATRRMESLLALDRAAEAVVVGDAFEASLANLVRTQARSSLADQFALARDTAVCFDLVRLAAILPSADAATLRTRIDRLRATLAQPAAANYAVPRWSLEVATAHLAFMERNLGIARSALDAAIAQSLALGAPEQAAQCAIAVRALCARSEIDPATITRFAEASSAIEQIADPRIRSHLADRASRVAAAGADGGGTD